MNYMNPALKKSPRRLSTSVRLGVVAVAACFISAQALANPLNPTVVNGTASFNQAGSVLTVTNSNGAIINWDKFSIKAGETTHFAQTAASSTVLNRVLNDPTAIYGTLSSNGRVWLVNPAGIMVGPGGRIDVAGFVASTLNISNADFLAGRHLFVNDGTAKDVINRGEIRTPAGGSVYLIGSNVANESIITTPQGETILAAGATVSLIDSATPGVKVDITGAAGNATNLGTITAEAGRIGIAGVIVRNSGTLNASSVVNEGGRIFLKASQDAYVDGNGRIVTTGTKGGSVEVLGNRVAVMDNAEIDASGTNGGGSILVGGDFQGKNPEIQNANITYFGPNASLKADATEVGDGGTVIVWADDTTRAYGSISARGGATGGNGGLVETSGHRALSVTGARVDTRAPNGQTGDWLLDPSDISIVSGVYGSVLGGVFDPLANSTITDGDINAALGLSNLTIQTSGGSGGVGNITMTSADILGTGNSLSLLAYGGGSSYGGINISNSTIALGTGALALVAGWDGLAGASLAGSDGTNGNLIITDSMLSAGPITMKAVGDISVLGVNTGTWIQSSGAMDLQASNIFLTGGSAYGLNPSFPDTGAGVLLQSFDVQTVTATNSIVLQAGSANNALSGSPFYGGSVSIVANLDQTIAANVISLYGGAAGHDNSASITGGGNTQSINVTSQLVLTGGAGGNDNYAWIGATGNATAQTIYGGGANIVLTGGASGGAFDQENSADISLSDMSNFGGSQTVYAGNITINGGSATYGGAGFGGNGLSQSFYVSGDLTMNGGSSSNSNFRATPAYIGSESGGGTINVNVGGNIVLNGGSGTAGGVLIGALNGYGYTCPDGCYSYVAATSVTLSAGKSIIATGNTGGVWLGVKDLTGSLGSSVTLMAGTDNGFSGNGYGGNVEMVGPGGTYIQTDASGSVNFTAFQVTAANGNITQNESSAIYGGNVTFFAEGSATFDGTMVASTVFGSAGISCPGGCYSSLYGGSLSFGSTSNILAASDIVLQSSRDITINGQMTSTSGSVNIAAGLGYAGGYYSYSSPFGGNVNVSGIISAGNSVNISANVGYDSYANGNITQTAGSILANNAINIAAGGSVGLGGTVGADFLSVRAGYQNAYFASGGSYTSGVTPYGGNISVSGALSGNYGVQLIAEAGSVTGLRGDITQSAGSIVAGFGQVRIIGGGNVVLNGSIDGGEGGGTAVTVTSGLSDYYSTATPYGGDISMAGTIVGYGSIGLFAESGSSSGTKGNITQSAGSITATSGDVTVMGHGDVTLGGSISSPLGSFVGHAGLGLGGTVAHTLSLGAITAYGSIEGYSSGGLTINGPLNAATSSIHMFAGLAGAGGTLTINGNTTSMTNAEFVNQSGSITQAAGSTVSVSAGSVDFDNSMAPAGSSVSLSVINAPGLPVTVLSSGPILDNNGTDLNITAGSIFLNSQYGGAAGGLAISMDTSATSALYGFVAPGATYGGIEIRNSGTSPSYVSLMDQASLQSSANFTQYGDLTVGYGGTVISMMADDLALLSTGNMTIGNSGLSLTAAAYGSVLIGASGNLLLDGADIFPAANVDVGLAAGGSMTLTNGAYVHGENLVAIAGQELSLAYGSEIGAWQSALVAAGSGIRLEDSHIHSDYADAFMLTGGDIRVNDGSSIYAGNSVYLTMNGGASTLYINEFAGLSPSRIHAVNPNTININFGARPSGGIVIDGVATTTTTPGGSGFFVGSSMVPATAGAGLAITYAATTVTVDPCVSNPDLCKPPSPIENPIVEVLKLVEVDPCAVSPDSAQCKALTQDEQEKDSFGDEDKDGKKDEKSRRKKVSQCSI